MNIVEKYHVNNRPSPRCVSIVGDDDMPGYPLSEVPENPAVETAGIEPASAIVSRKLLRA